MNFCPDAAENCYEHAQKAFAGFFGDEGDRTRMPLRTMIGDARTTSQHLTCKHMLGNEGAERFEQLENLHRILERDVAGMCLLCARAGNSLKQECSEESHK